MKKILAIDPGLETGFVLGEYDDDADLRIVGAWQTTGGLDGATPSLRSMNANDLDTWVFEKFRVTPRVYKSAEVEALRFEGAVRMLRPDVVMQYNGSMLLAGGGRPTAAKNKQAADAVLRRMGLWHTGSMIGAKDANDVNAATKHLVAYLREAGHAPTLEALRNGL